MKPLPELKVGQQARVAEVRLTGGARQRLSEMGLLVGTSLRLVRFAPLGDPVEIELRGYHLSLRRQEAEGILVDDLPGPGAGAPAKDPAR